MVMENFATEWNPKFEAASHIGRGKNYKLESRDGIGDSTVKSIKGAKGNRYTNLLTAAISLLFDIA